MDERKVAATNNENSDDPNEPLSYLCATCKDKFTSTWELVHHVQTVHEIAIYELASTSDVGSASQGVTGEVATDEGGNSNASIKEDEDEENAAEELALDESSCGTPEDVEANWSQSKLKLDQYWKRKAQGSQIYDE